jgi:hypothetical protein
VVGPLPLLLALMRKIGLIEVIDDLCTWDRERCLLSPGWRIALLILNILGGRRPLYRVHEFYEDTAAELLLPPGITPEHLHDDCLGRALDWLRRATTTRSTSSEASHP